MLEIVKSSQRGKTHIDWLESYHSFSFGEFHNPEMIHFGPLRVLNDDYVAAGGGFPTHPHKDMEIITYVVQGALEHRDSMGNGEVIYADEVQKMSAGKGIYHSEFNHSQNEPVHLYQTWIIPDKRNLQPNYEQRKFNREKRTNVLLPVASPDARGESIHISQDAVMFISYLEKGKEIVHPVEENRGLYLHLIEGNITANGVQLMPGDAIKVSAENNLKISADENSEFILFDVRLNFVMLQ